MLNQEEQTHFAVLAKNQLLGFSSCSVIMYFSDCAQDRFLVLFLSSVNLRIMVSVIRLTFED